MIKPQALSPRRKSLSPTPLQAFPNRRNSIIGKSANSFYYTTQKSEQQPFKVQQPDQYVSKGKMQVQEQFIPIEIQKLKYELQQKDQELLNTRRQLKLEIDERSRLRMQLEQKSEDQLGKEREITKLLAIVHQLQGSKKSDGSKTVSALQSQIDNLEKYITRLTKTVNKYLSNSKVINYQREDDKRMKSTEVQNKFHEVEVKQSLISNHLKANYQNQLQQSKQHIQQLEEERLVFIRELDKLSIYLKELVTQNVELQEKYQDKCLEAQKYKMMNEEIKLLEQELRGKIEEVKILKDQLYNVTLAESISKEAVIMETDMQPLSNFQSKQIKNLQPELEDTTKKLRYDQLSQFLDKVRSNYVSKENQITLGRRTEKDDDVEQNFIVIGNEKIQSNFSRVYSFENRSQ